MQNKLLYIESAQSQNRNWFSYVVNDPVNYVDLWGLCGSSQSPVFSSSAFGMSTGTSSTSGLNLTPLYDSITGGITYNLSAVTSSNFNQSAGQGSILPADATVNQNSNVDYQTIMQAANQYNYDYNSVAAVMRGENPTKLSSRSNAELNEMFATELRALVGTPYKSPGETEGVDCSNSITLSLNNMTGLNLINQTASDMATGKCPFITPLSTTNKDIQGDAGILNFYIWEEGGIVKHVNAGVGQRSGEPSKQVVDATEGDWMLTPEFHRVDNPNQVVPLKAHAVNQTYAPYINSHAPDKQGVINWDYIRELLKEEGR